MSNPQPMGSSRLNVILTIDFSPWSAYSGGAQQSTHHLAKALCRRGHDVSVVYTKAPWETVSHPVDLPYDIHWAPFLDLRSRRNAPLRPLNALTVARVVRNLLARKENAVVHANGEEGGMIPELRRHRHFGFVSTPHYPDYPQMMLSGDRLQPWQTAWLALTEGKYLMQGRVARHADLCVPPSAFAADLVRRIFHIDPSRLRVVHNGVPEEFLFHEHDDDRARNGPVVYFGRFDVTKGIDTFIEALALLGENAPPTLVIGRGPEEQSIRRRIAGLGLDKKVTLLPWMTQEKLASTLTGARLVAIPSRKENFSVGALSAMAVGAPVISTRVGGTIEIIEDGQTGLLVEPDDPHALAAAIERLANTPSLAYAIGRAGQKRVRSTFTWDRAAAEFEALYRTLPAVAMAAG